MTQCKASGSGTEYIVYSFMSQPIFVFVYLRNYVAYLYFRDRVTLHIQEECLPI